MTESQHQTNSCSDWLPKREFSPSTIQLVCFPYAGGGTAHYYRWPSMISDRFVVLPVHLPGRENRFHETAIDHMDTMTEALYTHVAPSLRPPFALFGHSMGALIAYELALRLVADGRSPDYLVVSACRSPARMMTEERRHELPAEAMIQSLIRDYGTVGATSDEELDIMRLLSATIQCDLRMVEMYTHTPTTPLPCPILAISATEDTKVTRSDVSDWRHYTTNSFTMRTFPGNHFYLREQDAALIRLLESKLG